MAKSPRDAGQFGEKKFLPPEIKKIEDLKKSLLDLEKGSEKEAMAAEIERECLVLANRAVDLMSKVEGEKTISGEQRKKNKERIERINNLILAIGEVKKIAADFRTGKNKDFGGIDEALQKVVSRVSVLESLTNINKIAKTPKKIGESGLEQSFEENNDNLYGGKGERRINKSNKVKRGEKNDQFVSSEDISKKEEDKKREKETGEIIKTEEDDKNDKKEAPLPEAKKEEIISKKSEDEKIATREDGLEKKESKKIINKEEFKKILDEIKTAQGLINFFDSAPGWIDAEDGLYNFADDKSIKNNLKKVKEGFLVGFGKEYKAGYLPEILKKKIEEIRNSKKTVLEKPKSEAPKEVEEIKNEAQKIEIGEFKQVLLDYINHNKGKSLPESFVGFSKSCLALVEKCEEDGDYEEVANVKESFYQEIDAIVKQLAAGETETPAPVLEQKTGVWEKVKGWFGKGKEIAKNKEVQDAAAEATYNSATSILGIKFVTDLGRAIVGKGDIAQYVKQKLEDRTIRNNFEALIQSRQRGKDEKLSEEERAEAASKFYAQAKNVFRAINESKRIDPKEKQEMKEKLKTLARDYEQEKDKNEKQAQKATIDVIEAYTKNKVSGMTIAKDFLNTALTATGTFALRGVMYAGAAAGERFLKLRKENIRKEVKGEAKNNIVKGVLIDSFTETFHELTLHRLDKKSGEISSTRKAADLIKAIGTLARIAGIGGLALGELRTEGVGIIQKTLENIEKSVENNVFEKGGMLNNFAANFDRLTLGSSNLAERLSAKDLTNSPVIGASMMSEAQLPWENEEPLYAEENLSSEATVDSNDAPEIAEAAGSVEIDTTIHKGDGYYDVFRRQIEADPEKFGYQDEGDVDDFIERKTREFLKTNDLWKNGKGVGLRYDPEARIVLNPDGTFVQSNVETYRMEIPKPRIETMAQISDKQAFDEAEMKIAENQMEINAAERIKMDANYLRAVNRIKTDFGADQAQRLIGKMNGVYGKLNNLEEMVAKHPVEGSDNLAGRIKDLKETFLKAQTDVAPSNYDNTLRMLNDIDKTIDKDVLIIQNQTGEAMTEETFFAKGSVVGEKMTTGSKDTLASAVKELSEKSGLKGDKLAEGILEYKMPSHDEVQDGLRELAEKGDKTAANLLKQTESGRINIRNSAFGRGTLYLKDHGYFKSSGVQFEEAKSLIDKNDEALSGEKTVSSQEAKAAIESAEAKVELLSKKATIAEAQKLINDKILIEDPSKAAEYGMKLNRLQGEEKFKFAQEILGKSGVHKEAVLQSLGVDDKDIITKVYEEADAKAVEGRELLEKERAAELDKEMAKIDKALEQEQIRAKVKMAQWDQEQKVFETERAQVNQEIDDMFRNMQRRYVDDPENLSRLNKQFQKSENILNKTSAQDEIEKIAKNLDKDNLKFFKELPHAKQATEWAKEYDGVGEDKVQGALKDLNQAVKKGDSSEYLKAVQKIESLKNSIEKTKEAGLVGILNKEDLVGQATAKPLDPDVQEKIASFAREAQQAETDAKAKVAEYAKKLENQEIEQTNKEQEIRDLAEKARVAKMEGELNSAEKQSEEAFKDAYKYLDEKQKEVDFIRGVNAEKESFNLRKEIKELEKLSAYLQRANEKGVSLNKDDADDFVTKLEMIKRNTDNDKVLEEIESAEKYLKKGGTMERYLQMIEDAVSQVLRGPNG